MNFIISTMTDFYQCCNIPVKAVSYELEEIYKIGYDEYFDSIYPLNDIYNLIEADSTNIYSKLQELSKKDLNKIYQSIKRVKQELNLPELL